jgi:hypothetical protein
MRIQQNNREARGHVRKSAVRLVAMVVGWLVTAGVRYGTLPLRIIANKKLPSAEPGLDTDCFD